MKSFGFLALILPACLAATVDVEKRFIAIEKCYGPLGCLSTGGPFYDLLHRPLQFLPIDRDILNVTFILHTRANQLNEQYLVAENPDSFTDSNFDAGKETKFIVHGFLDDARKPWVKAMSNALLKRGDYNVILVEWGRGAGLPYTQATANTRLVGAEIAYLIDALGKAVGSKPDTFHIIGHSLGAHIGGYAGERLKYLGRISGLDPAGPYFSGTDKVVRLDPTDALFVDVMHTDTGSILGTIVGKGGFGYAEPLGHVDVYPNGGSEQPNCDPSIITTVETHGIGQEGVKQYVGCDHIRSIHLYTESINSAAAGCNFRAFPCNNYEQFKLGQCQKCGYRGCTYMGFDADQSKPPQGQKEIKYFMETGGEKPFCRFNFGVTVYLAKNSKASTQRGTLFVRLQGTNGVTEELKLNLEAKEFNHGSTFGFEVNSDFNPGELNHLQFRWDNEWSILKPWELLKDKSLYVDKITVLSGQTLKQLEFCGNGNGVKPDVVRSLAGSQSCS